MKRMIRLATAVMAFLLLFSVVVLLRGGGMEKLSESEKFAMKALPGYFFVFEGQTNYISQATTHKAFLRQHPMMPYLELVTERLEQRPWAREFAIRVWETDTEVVITLPSRAERFGVTGPGLFDSGYNLKVTIDKKTMTIISAFQG